MNLQKAIEIKSRTGEEFLNTNPDEIDEAERLSIEAMKRIRELRVNGKPDRHSILLGETEE